ncbi:MAG: transporter substrate-binding domain-containing protein [Proteobacteria bacterium]|nr:transporter substrate-binding domain-containing protein [Pseudomonadota bacterium]
MHRALVAALVAGLLWAAVTAQAADPLRVCMAGNNPPLSYDDHGAMRGLDVRVAQAIADELQRPLAVVPFESKYEGDSTLSSEVDALLSSGVCELATGYAMMTTELGAPTRPTARVPDHPGAPPPPKRPWITLGTLAPAGVYHTMAMALVVRDPARTGTTLADIARDARIGAVGGTMSGTAVALYRGGKLRPQIVSLRQDQDGLAELEAGRIDATLTPLDRYDAWRLTHPSTPLKHGDYLHPLRINIGLVARVESDALIAAARRVTERARASGDLARWTTEAGATWVAPAEPEVSGPVGLPDLLRE